jgi:hypothetical protein
MARFCARCGLEQVAQQAQAAWGLAKVLGFLIAITLLVLFLGGLFFGTLRRTELTMEKTAAESHSFEMEAATEAQREAIIHKNDPWWDPTQPGGLKPFFFGKEYTVGPGEWTSIDVTSPVTSGPFRYVVAFEGISRFRARPNGEAEREFIYPNPENLQPYQLSGWCQTYLVQPLDNSVHRIRVKYVRVPRSQ